MTAALQTVTNPGLVRALMNEDAGEVQAGLARATLLVPAAKIRDGETVIQIRRGAAGRSLVCAFTDLEALQAWDRNPPADGGRPRRRVGRRPGRRRHGRAQSGRPRCARTRWTRPSARDAATRPPPRGRRRSSSIPVNAHSCAGTPTSFTSWRVAPPRRATSAPRASSSARDQLVRRAGRSPARRGRGDRARLLARRLGLDQACADGLARSGRDDGDARRDRPGARCAARRRPRPPRKPGSPTTPRRSASRRWISLPALTSANA